jgi:3-hydroxyisobutyrate dehydrogenase-like beta-hydroxyacid dehydrogenase
MGSAVGRRLSEHGARVLTSLTGRSIATVRRAEMTGMIGADDDAIAQADVILSILPPNEAFALAERFAAPLSRASHKAIFADCNAINVETVRRIDAVITPTGAAFVDGGIIGPPPGQSGNPTFYFSGQAAPALAGLCDLGLNVRIMNAPLGAASALKMSYAGINKGTTLLAAAMLLGATRAGAAVHSAPNYRKAGQSFWIAMPDQYRTCIQKLIAGRRRWKRSPNSSATIPPPALSSRGWRRFVGVSQPIRAASRRRSGLSTYLSPG